MLKNYSKPVLTNELNSSYKDCYCFTISINEAKVDSGTVKIRISNELNSEVLTKYISDGIAYLGVRIISNFRSKFIKFESLQQEYYVDVDIGDLNPIDTIKCVAYIYTKTNITYPWNKELKDYYDDGMEFLYNNNEVLAESNEERVEFSSSAEPFISLKASDERDNKGLLFDINSPNMITVKVGKKFNEAYKKLQSEDKRVCVKDILNSFLAFNSILYAITCLSMKDDISEDVEKEWYKSLDYCFDEKCYESLEDFIYMMHENINLDEIYRITQNILNNQLEYKVIETWRKC
ncbi:MAG: hypothetical protein ACI4U5_03360 [Bacilli bacterium]